MEIKTSEFFKNIKKLPPSGSEEFKQLITWEEEKIKGGITVNGVYISGWLYWHLNHWLIRVDDTDEWGNEIRKPSLPDLRDNEWVRAEALEQCRVQKKGYMEIGARQGAKSETEASFFGMNATMFEDTQNVIVCGNDNDLSLLKDKVDFGLKNLWDGIAIPRLDKTWRSNQVRLGYKVTNGDDKIWSYIVIRNAKDGHNTEVSAGTTAKSFIMDEVGKYPFSQAYEAGVPALKGKNGFRAIPLLMGTGGSFENGKDAENFFANPRANNFLEFVNEKGEETCLFLSGLYRQDCKYKTTLAEYLRTEKGMIIKKNSELDKMEMWVSDKELAKKTIMAEREAAKSNPDKTIFLKKKMYFPLTTEECFLSEKSNIYDSESARRQKQRLSAEGKSGTPVFLTYNNEGKIIHEFTDKQPISNFPIKPHEDKDAPIMIYEFPMENPPYGLYTAGCLLPGEKVMTDKGLKQIEQINFNDKLISKDGDNVNIVNLQRYYKKDEDVYELKISNTERTTTFTSEHPIYVSDPYGNNAEPIIENRFKFEFEDVKNINIGQWIKFPNVFKKKNQFDINLLWNKTDYRIDRQVDSPLGSGEFWWFIGLFLGDGYCDTRKGKISISFNSKEIIHIQRFEKLVNDLFNRKVNYRTRNNCVEAGFMCNQLVEFIEKFIPKHAKNKSISDWMKRIDDELKYQLVLGFLDSDGCVYHDKKRNYYSLDFVSISIELLEDIQDILFSLGYVSGMNKLRKEKTKSIQGRKESVTQETYHLRVGNNDTVRFCSYFNQSSSHKLLKIDFEDLADTVKSPKKGAFMSSCGDYIYFKIKNITKRKYTGWVYNFECETNTFLTKNITTHNCDPYRQGKAQYSNSLGSVYIYKRMNEITGESYQNMFVATYSARPDNKSKWEEQARLLIKYYNARTLCENDEISFIDHMISKNDSHYLEKQPQWLKEIVPNTTVARDYGIHRSAGKIVDFLNTQLKVYSEEVIYKEKDDEGSVIKEITGMSRIPDPMLLEEMAQFDEEGNYDRVIAAQLAIALANKLDPVYGAVKENNRTATSIYGKKTGKNKLFTSGSSGGVFGNRRRSNTLFK